MQSSIKVEQTLHSIMKELEKLAKSVELNYKKWPPVTNQLPDIACLMDIWWDWVNQSLSEMALPADVQQWAKDKLLPLVYWRIQLSKTSNPKLKVTHYRSLRTCSSKISPRPTKEEGFFPTTVRKMGRISPLLGKGGDPKILSG